MSDGTVQILNSGIIQVVDWNGAGWYAPISEGPGWSETHYYRVQGNFDRRGYDPSQDRLVTDEARRMNLGTPVWAGSLADFDE